MGLLQEFVNRRRHHGCLQVTELRGICRNQEFKIPFFSVSKICPDGGFNDFVNLGNLCDFMQSIEICDYEKNCVLPSNFIPTSRHF